MSRLYPLGESGPTSWARSSSERFGNAPVHQRPSTSPGNYASHVTIPRSLARKFDLANANRKVVATAQVRRSLRLSRLTARIPNSHSGRHRWPRPTLLTSAEGVPIFRAFGDLYLCSSSAFSHRIARRRTKTI